MSKQTNKLTVCFLVPLDSTDTKVVKAAYKEIGSQILKFAEAIKIDQNVIVSHSVISTDPNDMKPVIENLANPKIAELQTINKKIADGKSSLTNPKQPDTELPDDEDTDERPMVVAATDWKPPTPSVTQTSTPVSSTTDADLIKILLEGYGRLTEKTTTIVTFLVGNKDKELTADQIATGTGQEKISVNNWLVQSAPKSVEKVKRGVYLLNSSKIK